MKKGLIIGLLCCLLLGLKGYAMPAGVFEFLADSLSGNQGTQVVVPIRANNFDSIISIQGTVGFDSSVLAFVAVQNMNLPSMSNANFGTSYVVNGKLTFSWNEVNLTPISVADSTVLFAVVFQLVGPHGSASPVSIVGSPTLLEVVNWDYTPIPFTTRGGEVKINVPMVCVLPDSLRSGNVQQTQAEVSWESSNAGAGYFLEWGPWGYAPGTGIGSSTGTSMLGENVVVITNLQAGSNYEFYVREDCDSLTSVSAGPHGFATLPPPPPPANVIVFGDSIEGPQGTTDTLYVRVAGFEDLISAQGTLSWNPAVATYSAVIPMLPNMSQGNFGLTSVGQGILTFSWNDPTLVGVTIADSAAMFGVVVVYVGAHGAACNMDFVQSPTVWEMIDLNFTNAQLTLLQGHLLVTGSGTGVEEKSSIPAYTLYPNPVSGGSGQLKLVSDTYLPTVLGAALLNGIGQSLPLTWTASGESLECILPPAAGSGIWFLKVDTEAGPIVEKVIIDRR